MILPPVGSRAAPSTSQTVELRNGGWARARALKPGAYVPSMEASLKIVAFNAPAGSGKTTVANILARNYGLVHLSRRRALRISDLCG